MDSNKTKRVNYLNNKDLLAQVIKSREQNRMTDELAKMLQALAARYGKKSNFSGYCVDVASEVLTKEGWKSYDQLKFSDSILAYDQESEHLVWSRLLGKYVNSTYTGPMYQVTNNSIDAFVTPNHKFVTQQHGLIPVESIENIHDQLIIMGNGVVSPTVAAYASPFVELVGLCVGLARSYRTTSSELLTVTCPLSFVSRLQRILQELNIDYVKCVNETLAYFYCTGNYVNLYYALVPNNILSKEFILALTQSQRLTLLEILSNTLGWITDDYRQLIIPNNSELISSILMLCTITGLTVTHTISHDMCVVVIPVNPNCKNIDDSGASHNVTKPKQTVDTQSISLVSRQYSGLVWCPQTEYGTFVCKRNGHIYVTGNSYNQDMQAYAMLALVKTWKAFDPDKSNNPFAFFTQCIKNSFIQYLKIERRQRDIRDALLVDAGALPSYTYQLEHSSVSNSDDIDECLLIPNTTTIHAIADEDRDDAFFGDSTEC